MYVGTISTEAPAYARLAEIAEVGQTLREMIANPPNESIRAMTLTMKASVVTLRNAYRTTLVEAIEDATIATTVYPTGETYAEAAAIVADADRFALLDAAVERINADTELASTASEAEENGTIFTPAPNGIYTIAFGSEHVTLRLKDDWRDDAPEGGKVAYFLSGTDNESSYTGFAFVSCTRFSVWRKYRNNSRIANALEMLLTGNWRGFGKAYALTSGNCYICNRLLTTPDSIEAGIGPICAKKIG